MKLLFHLAFTAFFCAPVFAQIPDVLQPDFEAKSQSTTHEFCSHPALLTQAGKRALVKRPYDVLEYKLTMDWTNPLNSIASGGSDRRYSGINEISIRSDSTGLQLVVVDAASIIIDSAFMISSGKRLPVQPFSSIKGYGIDLLSPKFKGDTFTVAVYYTYIGSDNGGFYLFPKGFFVGTNRNGDSVKTLAPIAYTMSEPEDARYWMPCNDRPDDKARFQMNVKVPFTPGAEENYIVSTSIADDPLITEGTASRAFTWKDTTLISTYLVSVNASYYVQYRQWYKRFSSPKDSIPIDNYVWKNDFEDTVTDGTHYNAKHALRRMPEMMGFLSERFIEYPFNRYGNTAIHPFNFGGMEHQTMSSINRSWLYGTSESGLLHELGHQWYGNLVTCATWADIWLNEGGATFTEALWAEFKAGKNGYRNFLRGAKNGYLSREQPAVYGIPIQNIFNYGTTYAKGAWINAMLRYVVGDSVFFPVMRQYFRDHAYSVAETEDLLEYFEQKVQNPAVPIRTFFEQWVYQRGHPIYKADFRTTQESATEYKTSMRLMQQQSGENIPDVFVMPVSLTFEGAKGERQSVTLLNNSRVQDFQIITPYPVVMLYIDRQENILCEKADTVVSVVESPNAPTGFSVSPNPVLGSGEFTVDIAVNAPDSEVFIALYDLTGHRVEILHDGVFPMGNFTISHQNNLPAGVYYVRATIGGKTFAAPLTVVR